jgi:predicted SnoaL-like aldol condensation-catalyzing enzyme
MEAFDAAFNRRDERYWSPNYIQHSAHIPPGREGLRQLMAPLPAIMRYKAGVVASSE